MNDYDNRGQVSLWKPQSAHPRAPAARGTVIAHRDIREGEEIEISLWRNEGKNGQPLHANAPLMKGQISDKYQAPHNEQPSAGPPSNPSNLDDLDDDIPF